MHKHWLRATEFSQLYFWYWPFKNHSLKKKKKPTIWNCYPLNENNENKGNSLCYFKKQRMTKKWQHFTSGFLCWACGYVLWGLEEGSVHNLKNGTSSGKRPHHIGCSGKLWERRAPPTVSGTLQSPLPSEDPSLSLLSPQLRSRPGAGF